jgi:hypothetical protein
VGELNIHHRTDTLNDCSLAHDFFLRFNCLIQILLALLRGFT